MTYSFFLSTVWNVTYLFFCPPVISQNHFFYKNDLQMLQREIDWDTKHSSFLRLLLIFGNEAENVSQGCIFTYETYTRATRFLISFGISWPVRSHTRWQLRHMKSRSSQQSPAGNAVRKDNTASFWQRNTWSWTATGSFIWLLATQILDVSVRCLVVSQKTGTCSSLFRRCGCTCCFDRGLPITVGFWNMKKTRNTFVCPVLIN